MAVREAPKKDRERYVLVLYQGADTTDDNDIIDMGLVMRLRQQCAATIADHPSGVEIDVWLEWGCPASVDD